MPNISALQTDAEFELLPFCWFPRSVHQNVFIFTRVSIRGTLNSIPGAHPMWFMHLFSDGMNSVVLVVLLSMEREKLCQQLDGFLPTFVKPGLGHTNS